jgi:hypothetical protein
MTAFDKTAPMETVAERNYMVVRILRDGQQVWAGAFEDVAGGGH